MPEGDEFDDDNERRRYLPLISSLQDMQALESVLSEKPCLSDELAGLITRLEDEDKLFDPFVRWKQAIQLPVLSMNLSKPGHNGIVFDLQSTETQGDIKSGGAQQITGYICEPTRHSLIEAGEAGADLVLLRALDADRDKLATISDLIQWWQSISSIAIGTDISNCSTISEDIRHLITSSDIIMLRIPQFLAETRDQTI